MQKVYFLHCTLHRQGYRGFLLERKSGGHVEMEGAIGSDMGVDERCEGLQVAGSHAVHPCGFGQHFLNHEGVDID